ncbi:hypothetical protein ACJRO7_002404 [Eucalyptus globulus]|uniref:Uncharacterized protein n=1 Tax=Eucalyptus globulus TaxID=34317 RepID=A0ABD3LUD1_EUCGL
MQFRCLPELITPLQSLYKCTSYICSQRNPTYSRSIPRRSMAGQGNRRMGSEIVMLVVVVMAVWLCGAARAQELAAAPLPQLDTGAAGLPHSPLQDAFAYLLLSAAPLIVLLL